MRKIKMFSVVSMDGFEARVDGDTEWTLEYTCGEGTENGNFGFRDSVDSVLMNGSHLKDRSSPGTIWPYGDLTCYVIPPIPSEYLPRKTIRFMTGDRGKKRWFIPEVEKLLETDGKDIWLAGDGELRSALMDHSLLEEIYLTILPVTLGHGRPLFRPFSKEYRWALERHETDENGVVRIHYSRGAGSGRI